MADRKSRKDSYTLLAARFLVRVNTEWRDSFNAHQRDFISWVIGFSVARGEPELKVYWPFHLFDSSPHPSIDDFKPWLGFVNETPEKVEKFLRKVVDDLQGKNILKVWDSEDLTTLIIDLSWTPERISVESSKP